MGTHTIGTGGDYTTIAAWETAQNTGTFTADVIGECKAQAFSRSGYGTIDGGTPGSYWLRIRAESGAEHDGRSHSVSGAGNARYTVTVDGDINFYVPSQTNVEVSWMELSCIRASNCGYVEVSGTRWHHNVMYCTEPANTSGGDAIRAVSGAGADVYRNIVFGFYSNGIYSTVSTADMRVLHNTVLFSNGLDNTTAAGITNVGTGTNWLVENNAVLGGVRCIRTGLGSQDNNATTDATGDSGAGLTNLTASDQIQSATDDTSTFDCRIKGSSADIYQAGNTTYSTTTYPQINVPISDRGLTISGTWSVGADEPPPTNDLTATGLTTGAPALGTPSVGQTHALDAAGLASGAPTLGAPTIGEIAELDAEGIDSGSPVLDAPTMYQVFALNAADITTGEPVLDAPDISTIILLAAEDLAAGSPELGIPTASNAHPLSADDLIAGFPSMGVPVFAIYAVITPSAREANWDKPGRIAAWVYA